jgi:hypothetical protein
MLAVSRGAKVVDLGMDAEFEKKRFGAVASPTCVYVRASDHYNGEVLREIVAEVGVGNPRKIAV